MEIRANSTLEELDDFLRGNGWNAVVTSVLSTSMASLTWSPTGWSRLGWFADPNERTMKVKLGEVLSKGSRFQHTYDFGTSTELKLRVVDERQGRIGQRACTPLEPERGASLGV